MNANGVGCRIVWKTDGLDLRAPFEKGLGHPVHSIHDAPILAQNDRMREVGRDEVPCKIEQATVRDNFVFNWRGGLQIYGADEDIVEIGFEGNTLIAAEAPLVTLTEDYSGFSTKGNQYRGEDGEGWFRIGETTYMALDEWKVSHEPSAEVASDTLPTAPPTLAGYAQSIGAGETGTDFILEARQLSRDNYRPEYMATGVNAYFRDQLGHEE